MRLIDVDKLNRKDVNCANVPMNFIDTAPTVEIIPTVDTLDKIKTEIENIYCGQYCENPLTADMVKERVLEIIDKYKEN